MVISIQSESPRSFSKVDRETSVQKAAAPSTGVSLAVKPVDPSSAGVVPILLGIGVPKQA